MDPKVCKEFLPGHRHPLPHVRQGVRMAGGPIPVVVEKEIKWYFVIAHCKRYFCHMNTNGKSTKTIIMKFTSWSPWRWDQDHQWKNSQGSPKVCLTYLRWPWPKECLGSWNTWEHGPSVTRWLFQSLQHSSATAWQPRWRGVACCWSGRHNPVCPPKWIH